MRPAWRQGISCVRGDLFTLGLRGSDDEGQPNGQLLWVLAGMNVVLVGAAGAVTWARDRPRLR